MADWQFVPLSRSTCNYLGAPHHQRHPRKSLLRASDSPVQTTCTRPRSRHRAGAMYSFASFALHATCVCHTTRDTCPPTSGKRAPVVPANDCHMRNCFVAAHSGAARPCYGCDIANGDHIQSGTRSMALHGDMIRPFMTSPAPVAPAEYLSNIRYNNGDSLALFSCTRDRWRDSAGLLGQATHSAERDWALTHNPLTWSGTGD